MGAERHPVIMITLLLIRRFYSQFVFADDCNRGVMDMLHWRLLMAALVLAFVMGLTAPLTGLTSGMALADPDDPYVDEDPDDP